MEIKINGRAADITLDKEKTIGEIMAGMEQWISGSGHRLSGISIDGESVPISNIEKVFAKEKDSVKTLDISTLSVAELTSMSLASLIGDIDEFEKLEFENKKNFFAEWKERAQVQFITEQIPELFAFCVNAFAQGTLASDTLRAITEEMLREVNEPTKEFASIEPLLDETCARLVDLPLDIQTGKDERAARTIQIFSGVSEKILRVLRQLNVQGYLSHEDGDKPFPQLINEFGKVVKDLLEAYEKKDTVLIGDLAEYEASPKLKEFYTSIFKKSRQPGLVQEGK